MHCVALCCIVLQCVPATINNVVYAISLMHCGTLDRRVAGGTCGAATDTRGAATDSRGCATAATHGCRGAVQKPCVSRGAGKVTFLRGPLK